MILALLACVDPHPATATWTPMAAVSDVRARVDVDGDARVTRAEWERVAPYGPAFPSVDADADGDVSTAEFVRLARGVDPAAWLEATARTQPGRRIPPRAP